MHIYRKEAKVNRFFEKTAGVLPFLLLVCFSGAGLQAAEKGPSPGEVRIKMGDCMVKVFVPASVEPGKEAQLKLVIRSVHPWKINRKFPFKVFLSAGKQVTLKKTAFKKADASRIEDERVVFFIPFTVGSEGKFDITLKVELSVCKEGSCHSYWGSSAVPVEVTVTVPGE
jgi:hypothetical protein